MFERELEFPLESELVREIQFPNQQIAFSSQADVIIRQFIRWMITSSGSKRDSQQIELIKQMITAEYLLNHNNLV